jgi:hypothetical protein
MLYVQYLQDNGNDMQAAYVFRRDVLTGDAKSDQATAAIKYHGFAGETEYDLLAARSYGDAVIGVGTGRGIGGQGVESAVQSGAPTWSLPTRTSIRTPSS